jgi:glycosyltransferase involved in cell wall biosynthesis
MATPAPVSGAPAVSVIVPARNEEDCIGACLHSLVSQTGVPFEIILVDDGSTDRTRAIAASFPQVKIIDPGPPPAGWSGKNNAVTAGARVAQGKWLLFTDADTVHLPSSLARALAEARDRKAALLSYSPEQDVRSLAEKAVMPVIFAELAATFRPAEISDPNSPAAAANGQYILIERAVYNAIGGHAAVAGSLLEDVALARAVKQSSHTIFFRYGGDIVRTRMYRSFLQLVEGWTKNLALLFPYPAELAVRRVTEFVLLAGSLLLTIASFARTGASSDTIILLLATAALWLLFFRRIRRAHFPWDATLLAPLGLPLFAYLLLRSKIKHTDGGVSWKGRIYGAAGAQSSSNDSGARPAVKQNLRPVP